MRNGILLAEDSPNNLLSRFGCSTLEDAFLSLCQKHGVSEEADHTLQKINSIKLNAIDNTVDDLTNMDLKKVIPPLKSSQIIEKKYINRNLEMVEQRNPTLLDKLKFTTKRRMKALLAKNILQMMRQPAGMVFVFFFPIFQLVCFYVAVGGNPKGLRLGVVNEEVGNYRECYNDSLVTTFVHDSTCDIHKVSCRFLDQLNDSVAIKVTV